MNKKLNSFLDYSEFTNLNIFTSNKYTTITIGERKNPPSTKYFFKTFNFQCNSTKLQKIILETFNQINNKKCQYLQSYNSLSFVSFHSRFNPTFSMKYISSTNLEILLQNPNFKNEWKLNDALNCLFAVAKSLSYLHDNLIFHGNLNPSNIIVDEAKQCYVCDFGLYPIKKLYIMSSDMTNNDYKDPMMISNDPVAKNDVYSFGILMFKILYIFLSTSNNENDQKIDIKFEQTKLKNLPNFYSELISNCIDTDLSNRPSFKQILNSFQISLKDEYEKFIKSNYIENLAKLGNSSALNELGEMLEEGKNIQQDHEKAFLCYQKAALNKNSEAQSNYGVLLQEESNSDRKSKEEGANFLKLSADQGNINGMANYGIALKNGDGVKRDLKKAEEYLKKSADLGSSYAQVNYGYTLLEFNPTIERVNEGLKYIKMAIDQDDPDAYFTYAVLLKVGDVIEKNEQLAMDYFKLAADKGYDKAMFEYAKGYLYGQGVPQNDEIALKYFTLAYENGFEKAKKKMEMLLNKKAKLEMKKSESSKNQKTEIQKSPNKQKTEIQKSPNKQKVEIQKSSSKQKTEIQNSPNKQKVEIQKSPNKQKIEIQKSPENDELKIDENVDPEKLLSIFKSMKNEYKETMHQKEISEQPLFKYEDAFIKTKNATIIYKFGKLYDDNNRTTDNDESLKKAMKYYKIAADLGNAKAQACYGVALQNGKEITQNLKLGLFYLEKSANQGDLNGMSNYGLALYNGDGTEKNETLGLKFLKKAADEGYPFAQLNYGICAKDQTSGHQYLDKLVKLNYKKAFFYYARNFLEGHGVEKDIVKAESIFHQLYDMEKKTKVLVKLIECLIEINYKDALVYMKILADLNDPNFIDEINDARFQYGIDLIKGNNIEKNISEGLNYLKKSNLNSKIKKKFPIIYQLIENDPTEIIQKIDVFLLKNSDKLNDSEKVLIDNIFNNDDSFLKVAQLMEKMKDFESSNFFYIIAAKAGIAEALFIIGKNYLDGKNGLNKNQKKGKEYLKKAAEKKSIEAKYELIKLQYKSSYKNLGNKFLIYNLLPDITELASQKFVKAIILKAKFLVITESYNEAKEELNKALPLSQNNQELLYKIGKVFVLISKDDQFGFNLIENSVNDVPKAAYFLGKYYYDIRNKSPEYLQKAKYYLKIAGEKNIKNSNYLLLSCTEDSSLI